MKIIQNQVYCIIPFYFHSPLQSDPLRIWRKQSPTIDSDALYPFIQTGSRMLQIFGIDYSSNPNLRKFWNQTSMINYKTGESTGLAINLLNTNSSSWLTPRLILSNSREQGMLVIPLKIRKFCEDGEEISPSSANLCKIINSLQKYDSGQTLVMTYRNKGTISTLQDNLDTYLKLCHNQQPHTWTFGSLIDMLICPLAEKAIMFKPYRTHILTYILGETSDGILSESNLTDFFRIIHCQNERYHINVPRVESESVIKTFDNILTGVSVEGSCVMANLQNDDGDRFLKSYGTGTFQTRMLWLYLILFMQRHVLLDIDRRLANASDGLEKRDDTVNQQFRNAVSQICITRLAGLFSCVSGYSHHNLLFRFIAEKLEVKSLYEELNEKLKAIDTWIKLVEEEMNHIETIQRRKFETFIQKGSVILAFLGLLYCIPQSVPALHETWNGSLWSWALICLVPAIAAIIWLLLLMRKSKG